MNIFQITKILNEAKDKVTNAVINGVENFTKVVDDHIEKLANAPKKAGRTAEKDKPENVEREKNEFLTKIINATKMETERLTGVTNETKEYRKEFMNRMIRFLANEKSGSYSNDIVIVRDIVAMASDDDIKKILNIPSGQGKRQPQPRNISKDSSRVNLYDGIDDKLGKRLTDFVPNTCGRFEMLLGVLFDGSKVSGHEGYGKKGDVNLGGEIYEVKKSGTGGVDTGWKQFQYLLNTNIDKSRKIELQKQIKELKNQEIEDIQTLRSSIEQFVKKTLKELIELDKSGNHKNDVSDFAENYFAMLDEMDKKRAILYGFQNIGYKNIIVCDNDGSAQFVMKKDIDDFIRGKCDISKLGIEIKIPAVLNDKNSKPKSADFQKITINLK